MSFPSGETNLAHPYAPFLYGCHTHPGVPYIFQNRMEKAFQTQFKTLRRKLTQLDNPDCVAYCAKCLPLWEKQLAFEINHPPQGRYEPKPAPRTEEEVLSSLIYHNQLAQAFVFVRVALNSATSTSFKPIENPVLQKAAPLIAVHQQDAALAFMKRYGYKGDAAMP